MTGLLRFYRYCPFIRSLSGLALLGCALLSTAATAANQAHSSEHRNPQQPVILVLYKDGSGQFTTHTNSSGELNLALDHQLARKVSSISLQTATGTEADSALPLTSPSHLQLPLAGGPANMAVSGQWQLEKGKPRRSSTEHLARLLIPFGAAAMALGTLPETTALDFKGNNLQVNLGHYLVLATVNNLTEQVGEVLAELLEDHHMGGVISPEWASKGAVAVLMLGAGQLESVASRSNLTPGSAVRFFSQSQLAKNSGLFLGEATGKVIDRITQLTPRQRKLLTSVAGGVWTTGLYNLVSTALVGTRMEDFRSKISNATIFSLSAATSPFIEDFIGHWTDNETLKSVGSQLLVTGLTIPVSGGFYYFLSSGTLAQQSTPYLLTKLVAGSLAKLGSASLARSAAYGTFHKLWGSDTPLTPAMTAAGALGMSLLNHALYSHFGLGQEYNPMVRDYFDKVHDGIFAVSISAAVTSLIEDMVRRLAPVDEQLNLRVQLHADMESGAQDR